MKLVLLSGLSGSGKSTALKALEDSGYFSIDNLPISFLQKFIDIMEYSSNQINKLAAVCDARDPDLDKNIIKLKSLIENYRDSTTLIYLQCDKRTLIKRFEFTRRVHPLSIMKGLPLKNAIEEEEKILKPIKDLADIVIDTTETTVNELRSNILGRFRKDEGSIIIQLISFGYKYGTPMEADNIFDVRFIPNPFFLEHLKNTTGLDKETYEFVLGQQETKKFIELTENFLSTMIPYYIKEGKSYLTIGFGCTGGRHRSVALVEYFKKSLNKKGFTVNVIHRDINR